MDALDDERHRGLPGQAPMKTPPRRITVHLRPVVRRLTALWMATILLEATMTVSMAYHARAVIGACWLALAVVFAYALTVLRTLRP
jgi:hypothetical protein